MFRINAEKKVIIFRISAEKFIIFKKSSKNYYEHFISNV